MGGVSLLGLGAKAVRSGEEALSRLKGPEAGLGFLERSSQPLPHQLEGLVERCKLTSGVWGRAPAETEFCAFQPKNLAIW